MASILRSVNFLRNFKSFTRTIPIASIAKADGKLLRTSSYPCFQLLQNFANATVPKADISLDRQLKRLDQDVRRIGRISRRDIEEVLEEIRNQRSATSSQSLLIIRCCGNLVSEEKPEVRTALVKEIWKTLKSLNVLMDISHFNALLRVYLENEYTFSPTEFLAELESNGIEPNRVTYQRLIERYCQDGNIVGATSILEFMREKKLPVNESVFNALILGHSQAKDMESAKGILNVMKEAGLEPSSETYSTLLSCYARHGDIDGIMATIAECEQKEIYLLDKDLLDVIYNLAIHNNADKIDGVLEKLRIHAGFNQDAVNTILRLVNRGCEDVAYKILLLMPRAVRADGQTSEAGSFFIRQLVKVNLPKEKILQKCKKLQAAGLNSKAISIAAEAALDNGNVETALALLTEMKRTGIPVRQHYFWPLMCHIGKDRITDLMLILQDEFDINISSETIREFIIPNLKEHNSDKIITLLHDNGISIGTAASATAHFMLAQNRINDAAAIMESYPAYYGLAMFKHPLIASLSATQDFESFNRIVRQIYESANRQMNLKFDSELNAEQELDTEEQIDGSSGSASASISDNTSSMQSDVLRNIIFDICSYFKRERGPMVEKVLSGFVKQGLSISSSDAFRITERLNADLTPKISELLKQLSSGTLEKIPLTNVSRKRGLETMSTEELERFISNVEERNGNAMNIKRFLLNACFRAKNLEKALEVIEKLEAENYSISLGSWAQLIDLYTHHSKVDEAMELHNKLREKDENFAIDTYKTLRIVEGLLKDDRYDDALKFLEQNRRTSQMIDSDVAHLYIPSAWRVLNLLAEKGEAEKLRTIFDVLVTGNYVLPNNVVLGSLIKVHIQRDDLSKAIETFEEICEKYKATPWKNEIACRLIEKEDAKTLQRITDLSTDIHGEVNSLYDLVFSFIECGRIRQARKILETPGMRSRQHRIENASERYRKEGSVEKLEGLLEATKDLTHVDRNGIYYNLLLSYCNKDDAEKALGLWTKMQEECVAPTEEFLIKLADYLKTKDMIVPFIVPEKPAKGTTTHDDDDDRSTTDQEAWGEDRNLDGYRQALKRNDLDAAVHFKALIDSKDPKNIGPNGLFIELLLQANRVNEAIKYLGEMQEQNRLPQSRTMKFFLNKVAMSGDIATISRIGDKLTDDQKRMFSYNNRLCHGYIVAGKGAQYIKQLQEEIENATTSAEASKLASRFPRGGAIGLLEKYPELIGQYREIAEMYAKYNEVGPYNVLWSYYTIHGNQEEADAIKNKYLRKTPRLMFQYILKVASNQSNENIVKNVVNQLGDFQLSDGNVGTIYSGLIDIQMNKGKYDEALESLTAAQKFVSLENISRKSLVRLKLGLEGEKKTFPYSIPQLANEDISSSNLSDADIDITIKPPETILPKPDN